MYVIISFRYAVVFINNYNLINRRRTILPYQVSVTELRAIEQVPEQDLRLPDHEPYKHYCSG